MTEDTTDQSRPNVIVRALQRITPRAIRKRFAVKFALVLVIMAVSIGSIGLAATQTVTDQTQERAEQQFEDSSTQKAEIVESWVANKRLTARISATSVDWTGNDTSQFTASLEEIRISRDGVEQAHLIDNTSAGPRVVSSTSLSTNDSLEDGPRSWFANDAQTVDTRTDLGSVYVSDTYEYGGQQVIGFVSKTNVGLDNPRWLFIEVSISDLRTSLQASGPRTTEIVDADSGVVMLSESATRTLEPYSEREAAREPIRRASESRADNGSAGVITEMPADPQVIDEPYTVGYAPVPNTNWVVLVQSPRSAEFGAVQTVSNWGLYVTVLAVLLVGLTGATLGYSTSTAIDRLTRKTDEMRDGNLNVDVSTSRIDNIGRLYEGFAEMRDSLKTQIQEAEQARKEAEVSRAEALEMSNYLEQKAAEYSDIMQQCAGGDLTQRMEQDGENDSMDTIAAEFNGMIEELEKTTGQLESYVAEVEEAGADVGESAETVRAASEQVADSIQKIADAEHTQQKRLREVSQAMSDIESNIEQVAARHPETDVDEELARLRDIAETIEEIATLSTETHDETDTVSAAAQEQAAELTEVSERADDLQRYAKPLRDILDRFETEAEHEFVFSTGPTGAHTQPDGGESD